MKVPGSWDIRLFYEGLPCILTLSDDILIDHIFVYLSVEDIFCLRRVNKFFYNITHQGIVWKRFLKALCWRVPPLPPSARYAPKSLTSFESERLVTRALSLDQNWVSPHPTVYDMHCYRAHREILSMVILPGGKHLVASVSNATMDNFSLMVYVLDHRIGGVVPLAETPTQQRAYNLCAKYMTVDGVSSIVIGFTRRRVSSKDKQAVDRNLSSYNPILNNPRHKFDSTVPLRYVCTCLQISLDSLDVLANPLFPPGSPEFFSFARSQPPPFRRLCEMKSHSELSNIDIAELDGKLYIGVVKLPETIVFKELSAAGSVSILNCGREYSYRSYDHAICNFRILPQQGDVLVVLSVDQSDPPLPAGAPPPHPVGSRIGPREMKCISLISIYRIPEPERYNPIRPVMSSILPTRNIEDVQISDPSIINVGRPNHYTSADPSIHIFYRHSKNLELGHAIIRPDETGRRRYSLANISVKALHTFSMRGSRGNYKCRPHAIPGSHRSLVFTVPCDNRTEAPEILNIYSYILSSQTGDDGYGGIEEDNSVVKRGTNERRATNVAPFKVHPRLRKALETGVLAVAWDEGVGRIFFSKKDDTRLYIIDLAKTPKEDKTGQRLPVPLADDRMIEL